MVDNLWGELPDVSNVRAPYVVLKEQGNALGEITKGRLYGTVVRSLDGDRTNLTFSIIAPALNDYTYTVARAMHRVDLYPVMVWDTAKGGRDSEECANEKEFKAALGLILKTERVRKAIAGLLAQVNAERS